MVYTGNVSGGGDGNNCRWSLLKSLAMVNKFKSWGKSQEHDNVQ